MAAFLGTTGGACLSCSACAFASSFSWKRILREAPDAASMKFTLPVSLPVWKSDVYGAFAIDATPGRWRWLIPTRELAALVHERALFRSGHFHGAPQAKAREARLRIEGELGSKSRQYPARRLQVHRLPRSEVLAALETQVEGPYNTSVSFDQLLRYVR